VVAFFIKGEMSLVQLSVQQAQNIVEEIGAIVKQNINMMNEHGCIIASTDLSRVGHFHEGAKRIIDEHRAELYIDPDMATETMRMGINLPISHMKKIVGVIGITGTYEEVIGYGQVVKKMTEILIREKTEEDEKRLDLRVHSRFLEEWVLENGLLQSQSLIERGIMLGIDITVQRRVMVVSVRDLSRYVNTMKGQKLMECVENAIAAVVMQKCENIVWRNTARQILLLRDGSDQKMKEFAGRLCAMVNEQFGVCLAVGIDGKASNIHDAYLQADKSWRSAMISQENILAYDQITLELFISEISPTVKAEYVEKIFAGCSYLERRQWIGLLEVYFAANGSIAEASARLYIHKNTLQYKLKKLERLTGYDVRQLRYTSVFYMAMLFFKELET